MRKTSISLLIPSVIVILIFCFLFFRLVNLNYNSFTGDETNTLRFISDYTDNLNFYDFVGFLQKQERGPGQYLINYINYKLFGFNNELQFRIPYLAVSILSIYIFYIFVRKLFNNTPSALFITLVFSFNGLFIVFSRITQYQSFIIFLTVLSLFLFLQYVISSKLKFLVFSLICFLISVFFHLDAISFIVFFLFYFIYNLFVKPKKRINILYTLIIVTLGFILLSITFVLIGGNSSTLNYLKGRILGGGFMPKTPYFELGLILEMYMPLEIWILLFFCTSFSLLYFLKDLSVIRLKAISLSKPIVCYIYILFVLLFNGGFVISLLLIKPRLSTFIVYASSFFILLLILLSRKVKSFDFAVVSWFLTSFCIYFFFLKDPRTHVYIVFIPAIILIGFLINLLINKYKKSKYLIFGLLATLSFYLIGYYQTIFVDKSMEFLLVPKKYFGKDLPYENRAVKSSRKIFAITTNNHWMEIRNLFKNNCLIGTYTSNEKETVTNFYLSRVKVDLYSSKNASYADNIIFLEYPTTWGSKLTKEHVNSLESYVKLVEYKNFNNISVSVYGKRSIYTNNQLLCN